MFFLFTLLEPSEEVFPTCTCIYNEKNNGKWCEHALSLIGILSLLQELPDVRPNWIAPTQVLPLHTVSAHFFQRYGNQFANNMEKRTMPFLQQMIDSPLKRNLPQNQAIKFARKENKMNGRRPQYQTLSWKVAMSKIEDIMVGMVGDHDNIIWGSDEESDEEDEDEKSDKEDEDEKSDEEDKSEKEEGKEECNGEDEKEEEENYNKDISEGTGSDGRDIDLIHEETKREQDGRKRKKSLEMEFIEIERDGLQQKRLRKPLNRLDL